MAGADLTVQEKYSAKGRVLQDKYVFLKQSLSNLGNSVYLLSSEFTFKVRQRL